jgi:transposase-like protein
VEVFGRRAEEKIWIVLDGLRGEHSISQLCRCEGIAASLWFNGSKGGPKTDMPDMQVDCC